MAWPMMNCAQNLCKKSQGMAILRRGGGLQSWDASNNWR